MAKKKNSESEGSPILFKRTKGAKVLFAIMFIFFAFYTFTLVFPMVWAFVNSFKDSMEYELAVMGSAFELPKKWLWSNYISCMKELSVNGVTYLGMLGNSIWYVVVGVSIGIFCQVTVAYALTKYDQFRISRILADLVIIFITFPVIGKTGADYEFVYRIGLGDSPLYVVIFSLAGLTGNYLIFSSCWRGVSNTYAEAARIDGAGDYTVYLRIMFPMLKGPMVALAIISAIGAWNSYTSILMYLPSYPTLATGLFKFQSATTRMLNTPVYYAGVFLSMLPTLITFCFFSETIMTNVTQGGLKG